MSIDKINTIDLIGTDKKSGNIILTISDHLDWIDSQHHLKILQEKINTYLRFIESGEIYMEYPQANGKKLLIEIVGKYDLPIEGKDFLKNANLIVKKSATEIRFSASY
jgi:hypothetical protein